MMSTLFHSFRGRLTLYLGGLTLIFGLVLTVLLSRAAEQRMLAARGITLQTVAQNVAGRLFYNLRERKREIELLSQSSLLTSGNLTHPDLIANLERIQNTNPYFAWLAVADSAGVIRSSTAKERIDENVSDRDWFIKGFQELTVSDVQTDNGLSKQLDFEATMQKVGEPVRFITFSAPIFGANGEKRGVLVGQAYWGWLQDIIRNALPTLASADGVEVILFERSRKVIHPYHFREKLEEKIVFQVLGNLEKNRLSSNASTSSNPPNLAKNSNNDSNNSSNGNENNQNNLNLANANNDKQKSSDQPDFDWVDWGNNHLYLTTRADLPVGSGLNTGWTVVVRQSEATALSSIQTFYHLLLVVGLAGASLVMFLAYRIASDVSEPLERITRQAKRVAQGENVGIVSAPILRKKGQAQEIQQLETALSSMTGTLLQQQKSLEQANAHLEQRVTERTTELRTAYQTLSRQANDISDLYNYAPVGYHSLDSKGMFRFINDRALEWIGYTRDEVIQKMYLSDLLTPASQDIWKQQSNQVITSESQPTYDLDLQCKDSSILSVRVNTAVVLDEKGQFSFTRTAWTNITHLKELERQLQNEQRLNHAIIHSTSNGLALYNSQGDCILINQTTADLIGTDLKTLQSVNFHESVHWKSTGLYEAALRALNGENNEMVLDFVSSYGKKIDCLATLIRLEHDHEYILLVVLKDVSDLVRANRELAKAARIDVLTNIHNRLAANEKMNEEFARLKRFRTPFSVLMLDVDFFKRVNDTYGHEVGDRVLIAVAQTVKSSVRTSDFVARFGGEEFVAILSEIDVEGAKIVAEKIRAHIEEIVFSDPAGLRVTVSIGASQVFAEDSRVEDALIRADSALYQAKHQGRNRVIADETQAPTQKE